MANRLALLGDSVFDNGAYVGGGLDVVSQVRKLLPADWQATLFAVDGSLIEDIDEQVIAMPEDVTYAVVSIGGNDVLANLDVMSFSVRSTTEALTRLRDRVRAFERSYRAAVARIMERVEPTILCTIYNGNLSQDDAPLLGLGKANIAVLRVGLAPFNDIILKVAFENRLDVIDLRLVCCEPADYANPIEPSSRGGEKIAWAIVRALGLADPEMRRSRIYT